MEERGWEKPGASAILLLPLLFRQYLPDQPSAAPSLCVRHSFTGQFLERNGFPFRPDPVYDSMRMQRSLAPARQGAQPRILGPDVAMGKAAKPFPWLRMGTRSLCILMLPT